jgi:predicted TIM-barrel fold metal-dependent hydrolase
MPIIDADAHVVETEATWNYMTEEEAAYRPIIAVDRLAPESSRQYWVIDGKVRGFPRAAVTGDLAAASARANRDMMAPEEARNMENIEVRLKHMDELGIDVQVLQPTIFIEQVADRPEVEIAMCKSYNRWLAHIWQQAPKRLLWVAMLPLLDMDVALRELHEAVKNGACGVFLRGFEVDRSLDDPYFFPLYEEASKINIPMIVHVGNASAGALSVTRGNGFAAFRLPCVAAFHSLIMSGVPEKFPELRFGFLESAASWIPFAITDLKRRFPGRRGRALPDNVMKEYRMWVACQTDDDIEYIVKYAGEDNLVIGTDYGHSDQSTEIEALRNLQKDATLDQRLVAKILYDNPKALYALDT